MSDLIRREDATKAVYDLSDKLANETLFIDAVIDTLENLPSAEPERTNGEWIQNFDGNEWHWYCSNCKKEWYEEDLWMGGNDFPNFCPNCGADMRGE